MKQNTTSGKTGYKLENVVGEGLLYCLVNTEKFDDISLDFVELRCMLCVPFHWHYVTVYKFNSLDIWFIFYTLMKLYFCLVSQGDIFVNLTCIIRDAIRVKNLVDFFMLRAPGVCNKNCGVTAWQQILTVLPTQLLFVPLFAICNCQQLKQKLPGGMNCADSSAWYLNTFSFLYCYRKLMLSD